RPASGRTPTGRRAGADHAGSEGRRPPNTGHSMSPWFCRASAHREATSPWLACRLPLREDFPSPLASPANPRLQVPFAHTVPGRHFRVGVPCGQFQQIVVVIRRDSPANVFDRFLSDEPSGRIGAIVALSVTPLSEQAGTAAVLRGAVRTE